MLQSLISRPWYDQKDSKSKIVIFLAPTRDEKINGQELPSVATDLNNLGVICINLGRLDEALSYAQRCLAISEKVHGPSHLTCGEVRKGIEIIKLSMNVLARRK